MINLEEKNVDDLEIKFDLWPEGTFHDDDAKQLDEVLSYFGRTRGGVSSNLRGDVFQIIIEFISISIAAGFFAKLGEDVYKVLKKKFIAIIKKPFERNKEETGILWISTHYNKTKIRITLVFNSETGLEKFLIILSKYLNYLKKTSSINKVKIEDLDEIEFEFSENKKKNPLGWKHSKKLIYKLRKRVNRILVTIDEGEIK